MLDGFTSALECKKNAHFAPPQTIFGCAFVFSFRISSTVNDIVTLSLTGSNQTTESVDVSSDFASPSKLCNRNCSLPSWSRTSTAEMFS